MHAVDITVVCSLENQIRTCLTGVSISRKCIFPRLFALQIESEENYWGKEEYLARRTSYNGIAGFAITIDPLKLNMKDECSPVNLQFRMETATRCKISRPGNSKLNLELIFYNR